LAYDPFNLGSELETYVYVFSSFMRFWVEILFVQKTHEKLKRSKSLEFKASQLWESKIRNETFYNPLGNRDLFCALNEH